MKRVLVSKGSVWLDVLTLTAVVGHRRPKCSLELGGNVFCHLASHGTYFEELIFFPLFMDC